MFEEALLAAASPGVDPVGQLVAWHPDTFDWVRVEPCDLVGGGVEPGFWERSARVLPADAERTPTGPELAAVLAAFDLDGADGYDLVEAAAAWARLSAWAAANEARVLAALASRAEMRPDVSGYRSVNAVTNTAAEIAGRCQVTTRQAENQVGRALQLVEDFQDTQAALAAGLIDLRRARVITDELGGQDPEVRARVEAAALSKAPAIDAVALRRLVKRLLHELAPVETAERHRIARDGRYVAVTPASDGMAFLEALLPAEDATALNTALKVAAADAKRADTALGLSARTSDQRRADALAELGWAALNACADTATSHATPPATTTDDATHQAAEDATHDATQDASAMGLAHDAAAMGRAAATEATEAAAVSRGPGGASGGNVRPTSSGAAAMGLAHEAAHDAAAMGLAHEAAHDAAAMGRAAATEATEATEAAAVSRGPGAGSAGNVRPTPSGAGTSPRRRQISVHVTVPFSTLAGLDDEPGELEGYGPIPAHVARELAAEGVWTWLRTDPDSGQLLDLGRTKYRPSKALADFIVARDRTCRMPGCRRAARAADIDHIVPFAAGGSTVCANLQSLCETHHLIKHHGGWSVQRQPGGTTRWASPTGHDYRRPAEPIGPVR